MSEKIIIDTDPGVDDAVALLMAFAHPAELEVLGITAVAGNVPVSQTAINARKICELANRSNIKVFAGSEGPLKGKAIDAVHVHGRTGLNGSTLPEPVMELQQQHAVDFIIETLRNEPEGTVTLCTLGPQTNIAHALNRAPDIAPRIKQIVMMGGSFFAGGNMSPVGEFNVYADPESTAIVLAAGIPTVIMPLDVTHKAIIDKEKMAGIQAINNRASAAVIEVLEAYERISGGPLHDPTVIAYLLNPAIFSGKFCNVEVELDSPLTRGMTVVDWRSKTDRAPNATWMTEIDNEQFYQMMKTSLAKLA